MEKPAAPTPARRRATCTDVGSPETEAARADRRAVIEARVAGAVSALGGLKAPRQADPQAAAIAGLVSDMGVTIAPETVSRCLGLATVAARNHHVARPLARSHERSLTALVYSILLGGL